MKNFKVLLILSVVFSMLNACKEKEPDIDIITDTELNWSRLLDTFDYSGVLPFVVDGNIASRYSQRSLGQYIVRDIETGDSVLDVPEYKWRTGHRFNNKVYGVDWRSYDIAFTDLTTGTEGVINMPSYDRTKHFSFYKGYGVFGYYDFDSERNFIWLVNLETEEVDSILSFSQPTNNDGAFEINECVVGKNDREELVIAYTRGREYTKYDEELVIYNVDAKTEVFSKSGGHFGDLKVGDGIIKYNLYGLNGWSELYGVELRSLADGSVTYSNIEDVLGPPRTYLFGRHLLYQNLNTYSKIDGNTGQVLWTTEDVGIGLSHTGETKQHYIINDGGKLYFIDKKTGRIYARLSTSLPNVENDRISRGICIDEKTQSLVYTDNNEIICVRLP
jgi:DNA-binding beta-propeller fold protein YncE